MLPIRAKDDVAVPADSTSSWLVSVCASLVSQLEQQADHHWMERPTPGP